MVAGYIPFDAGRSAPRELPERVFNNEAEANLSLLERSLSVAGGLALAIGGYMLIEAAFKRRRNSEVETLGPQDERVRQFFPRILRSVSIRASREEVIQHIHDLPNVDGIRFEILGEPSGDEIRWRYRAIRGVIRLIEGPPKKGIEIQASVDEVPEGMKAAEVEASLRRILRSLKQFVEAGEIATISGQTHGRRLFSVSSVLSRLVHKFMRRGELRYAGAVLERD